MKELRFFGHFARLQAAFPLGFAVLVALGLAATRDTNSLFGTYARMFPVFAVLFPAVSMMSGRSVRDTALCFGAKRMACFWAREVFGAGQLALLTAASQLLARLYGMMPGADSAGLSAGAALLLLAGGAAAGQIGLLLGDVNDRKMRGWLWAVLMVVLIGGFTGMIFALSVEGDPKKMLVMAPENPYWTAGVVGFAVLTAVLGTVGARLDGKAAVTA